MKRWLAAGAFFALGAALWFARTEPAHAEPGPAIAPSPALEPQRAPQPTRAAERPPAPAPAPAPAEPPRVGDRALASAQTTVGTQLTYLEDNQFDLFVQTFSDGMRPQVTREVFEACRTRTQQVPVRPDWEMAEESTQSGHRVLSVSMFGKSMTRFEELEGRWLAREIWCVPVGLP